jgi:hypothetical protein
MINPTGGCIRRDSCGFGYFGAVRVKENGGRTMRYRHRGVDYVCLPGQEVWMPFTSVVIRRKVPHDKFNGMLFRGKGIVGTLFYVDFEETLIGKEIKGGDLVGYAEDISKLFPDVVPHVHFQIDKIDPEMLISIYRMLEGGRKS